MCVRVFLVEDKNKFTTISTQNTGREYWLKKGQSHFLGVGSRKGQATGPVLICGTGKCSFVSLKDPQKYSWAIYCGLSAKISQGLLVRSWGKDVQRKSAQCDLISKSRQEMNFSACSKLSATLFHLTVSNKPNRYLRAEASVSAQNFFNHCAKGGENLRRKPSLLKALLKIGCELQWVHGVNVKSCDGH